MRKIVYSGAVKGIAVFMFIISIVCGVLVLSNGIYEFSKEDMDVYDFGEDFSQSTCITSLLDAPQNMLYNIYYDVYYTRTQNGDIILKETPDNHQEIHQDFENRMEKLFGNPENFEKLNYYVQWNGLVFANGISGYDGVDLQGTYYVSLQKDAKGYPEIEFNVEQGVTHHLLLEEIDCFDALNKITLIFSIKPEVIEEYKVIWQKQADIVNDTCVQLILCGSVALLTLVYLIWVCGKNRAGEQMNLWFDNVWLEFRLALIIGAVLGVTSLCIFMMEEYMFGDVSHWLFNWILGPVFAMGSAIVIASLLSIVRNIKTGRLIHTSILFQLTKRSVRLIIKIVKVFGVTVFRMLSKKTGVILMAMLFAYTGVVVVLTICTISSIHHFVWLIAAILVLGFACFVVLYRANDFDRIRKGAEEIRNGNVAYKIPDIQCEDMKILAENINDLARGFEQAVLAKVKAERLKTELITNVSHDLKTPITSIINYTQLLSQIEDLPEQAKDYVAIIAKKSDRLSHLTQDLFDISKVQSGNDDVVLEKLDVALLINQALAEHDNEIQSSNLTFCVEAPKGLYIAADGRKMSRVLSNLISNILKYTMKNTRVFITVCEKDDMIEMSFKNISAYPLNFNVEEITQRFVRGDESRTAEGNGLGLAIAKSYTEICNGTFDIVVDGDMFKAILQFVKYRK